MKAVIFCVETNRQSNTDWIYINETLHKFYDTKLFKYGRIYMDSKNKYKSKKVVDEINSWKEVYKDNLVIVYCVDTDCFESNPNHKRELDDIMKYCKEKNYELVWFCHDVEEVFWEQSVNDNVKKNVSIKFKTRKQINKVDEKKLRSEKMRKGYSNILCVLDRVVI